MSRSAATASSHYCQTHVDIHHQSHSSSSHSNFPKGSRDETAADEHTHTQHSIAAIRITPTENDRTNARPFNYSLPPPHASAAKITTAQGPCAAPPCPALPVETSAFALSLLVFFSFAYRPPPLREEEDRPHASTLSSLSTRYCRGAQKQKKAAKPDSGCL